MKIIFKSEHVKQEFLKFIQYINKFKVVGSFGDTDEVYSTSTPKRSYSKKYYPVKRIREFYCLTHTKNYHKIIELEIQPNIPTDMGFIFDTFKQARKIYKYFTYLKNYKLWCNIKNIKQNKLYVNGELAKTGVYTLNRFKKDKMFNMLVKGNYPDNYL